MTEPSDLEELLGSMAVDSQAPSVPVDEETLATLVDGEELSPDLASQLVHCADSRALWVLAREGFEEWTMAHAAEQPSAMRVSPPGRSHSRSAAIAFFLLAACAFAGGTWYVWPETESVTSPEGARSSTTSSDTVDHTQTEQSNEPQLEEPPTDAVETPGAVKTPEVKPVHKTSSLGPNTGREDTSKSPEDIRVQETPTTAVPERPGASPLAPPNATVEDVAVHAVPDPPRSKTDPSIPKPTASTRTRRRTPTKSAKAKAPSISGRRAQLNHDGLEARGPTEFSRIAVDAPSRGFGQLRLNARPAAKVYVDGTFRGWTPLIDLRLPAGPHDVRLVYEHEEAVQTEEKFRVLIQADRTWATVRDNRARSAKEPPPAETGEDQ